LWNCSNWTKRSNRSLKLYYSLLLENTSVCGNYHADKYKRIWLNNSRWYK
jgi:hypothetical protein